MLQRFSLQNFKAFPQLTIEPALLTLLIGPNGTGKSSVLQALTLLKQSADKPSLDLRGPFISLGQYSDIVHGSRTGKSVAFQVELRIEETFGPIAGPGTNFTYEAIFAGEPLSSHKGHVHFDGNVLEGAWDTEAGASREVRISLAGVQFRVQPGAPPRIGLPLAKSGSSVPPDIDRVHVVAVEKSLDRLLSGVIRFLSNTFYVPAMRGFEQPSYPLEDSPTSDLAGVANPVQRAGRAASTVAYRRELEKRLSEWATKIVGTETRFRLLPNRQVSLESVTPHITVNIVNEGFGNSQLVHLLLQVALAPTRALVLVEEPEIHLHPGAQAQLCDVIVQIAQNEDKRIMATTHSEHILMGFLTAVAQGKLQSDELAIYYFERKNGYAEATHLPVDEKGRVEGGLRGFFEVGVEELQEYMKALTEPTGE